MVLAACDPQDDGSTPEPEPPAAQQVGDVVALTASGKLVSFNRAEPKTLVGSVAVTGLPSGESLLGIDDRPADSALYGLTSGGKIVTLEPDTGVATLIGVNEGIQGLALR